MQDICNVINELLKSKRPMLTNLDNSKIYSYLGMAVLYFSL